MIALLLSIRRPTIPEIEAGAERQSKMQSSTKDAHPKASSTVARLGFVVFLLLSPLLPYLITIAYDSYTMTALPARLADLPVYPNATLGRKIVRQDMENNQCLILILQYNKHNAPQESVNAFYESALLQSGWRATSGPFSASPYYKKSGVTLRIANFTAKSYRLYITFDMLPIFEPRCLP